MICERCGAENRDSAGFCNLCLAPIEMTAPGGRVPQAAASAAPRVRAMPLATASGPDWAGENASEHAWYVQRHVATSEAARRGLPSPGTVYAMAAADGQARYSQAIWWSASVFTVFAWLATMRVALHDWDAPGRIGQVAGTSVIVQAILIGLVGVAAACVLAAFVSGRDAWRATLVNAVFWLPLAALLAAVATVGGQYALPVVSLLALGTLVITATGPTVRGLQARRVPRV